MPLATETIPVHHEKDPKDVIWEDLKGHIERIHPTAGDILICIYERPTHKMIKGVTGDMVKLDLSGTDRVREDKTQGVVGLIVSVGPCYPERWSEQLGIDPMPGVGTWVSFRRGDGIAVTCANRVLVQLQGDFIRQVLDDPDVII